MLTNEDAQAEHAAQLAIFQENREEMRSQHAAQLAAQREIESARREHEKDMERRRAKLELLRMAKEILAENARNKPVQEAGITSAEIVAFANELAAQLGD